MANLTFDPETHTYHLGGQRLPSVTQILRSIGIIDMRWATEHALERGTAVHQAIQFLLEDDLDESSVSTEIAPYVAAFKQFMHEMNFEYEAAEIQVYSSSYRYAGRIDIAGKAGKDFAIVEMKSGKAPAWARLQLAAYAMCFDGVLPKRLLLELRKDGQYRLTDCMQPNDLALWMSCLAVYGFRRDSGTLNGGNDGSVIEG